MELKTLDSSIGQSSLIKLKNTLDRAFGSEWKDWEPETISIELGCVLDELMRDKIAVLQILSNDPSKFFTDPLFFIFSASVVNNTVADFDHIALPNSLEMAFAITEAKKLIPGVEFGPGVKKVIEYILREEGYTDLPEPFNMDGVRFFTSDEAKKEDLEKKDAAIKLYIKGMNDAQK